MWMRRLVGRTALRPAADAVCRGGDARSRLSPSFHLLDPQMRTSAFMLRNQRFFQTTDLSDESIAATVEPESRRPNRQPEQGAPRRHPPGQGVGIFSEQAP